MTVLLSIFVSGAAATSITEENITVDLEDQSVEASLDIEELTSSSFTYITNHPVQQLDAEIEGKDVECSFEEMTLGGEIRCPTDQRHNFSVKMDYRSSGLSREINGVNIFRYSQSIYRPVESYSFQVFLPEGTGIIDQQNVSTPVIEPGSGEVGSEGRRIHVKWSDKPSLGDTMSYQVTYEQLAPSYPDIIAVILVTLFIAGLYWYYRRRNSEKPEAFEELTEDENEVLEILAEEGDMLQKDVVDSSRYSKAKISGVISELEEKGVIEKEKEGRSNRIYVKEEFLN